MRYNKSEFNKEVNYYKQKLKDKKIKNIFIHGNINKNAFYSIAPLSRACADLKIDINVSLNSKSYEILNDIWKTYSNLKKKQIGQNEKALKELLDEINIKELNKYFNAPDTILKVTNKGFSGNLNLEYKTNWFVPFMSKKLKLTTDSIVKNVYALKKSENFSIGFSTIPDNNFLSHPLQDYMDSFAIAYNMYLSSYKQCTNVSVKASTVRDSFRKNPEKTTELMTTLVGLELEKDLPLPIFKKYKLLSKLLKLDRIKTSQATFFISGKGYHGKHIFGEKIGYPTKNLKSKWQSPGGIIYKFHWYPQSVVEDRPPLSRVSFTSTVPIDKLIESTLIDYNLMRKRNKEISNVLEKCDKVFVKSNVKNGSNFEVGLIKKDGTRRRIQGSDSDTRTIIHPVLFKETGKQYGRMANIPGGESFTTPSYVKGKIVGDVVINIDRSYRLNSKTPFVAQSTKKGYKIISGPNDVVKAFKKRKKDAWKNLLEQEKNKSLPQDLINLKKKNFENIGEFAINTNPNAKLCDYLIINEKIANMIHVAFGSGFEPDTTTEYHMDVVIDSPKQKLDIYGINKSKKEFWIIKSGKFVL
jgi:hypothetical protein